MVTNPDLVFGAAGDRRAARVRRRGIRTRGAFGPLITTPDGVVYPSARHLPSIGAGVGHAVFGWWWPTNPWTRPYRQDAQEPVERDGRLAVRVLPAAAPRGRSTQVDGFDPAYFMYFEDVDLGDRLAAAGLVERLLPDGAGVAHEGGHATERAPGAMAAGAPPQRLPVPGPPVPGAVAGAAALGAQGRAGGAGTAGPPVCTRWPPGRELSRTQVTEPTGRRSLPPAAAHSR